MIRVLFLITSLDVGGAEMMLLKIVSRMDRSRFEPLVVSLLPPGPVGRMMEDAGVAVQFLNMARGKGSVAALYRFIALARRFRPHVLSTWLYHADLLGTMAKPFLPKTALVWNLRCANMDFSRYAALTGRVVKACALLSRVPDAVTANSRAGLSEHHKIGYRPRREEFIGNGFDTALFRPDDEARAAARREWGIAPDEPAVGLFARLDPMKCHGDFFRAAGILKARMPGLRPILCGDGIAPVNPALSGMIRENGLADAAVLLGRRGDMQRLYPGLDVLCSASLGEGFPNVIGEAMSCGVPCVATGVGDCREIIGETGLVAPPADPEALAGALERILSLSVSERRLMGRRARERVERLYSIESVVSGHQELYGALAQSRL